MIEKITFKKGSKHKLSYISELPAIENMGGVIEFKPGINILIGPNGCGKTSVLKAIGDMFAASQYGHSCLSKAFLMEVSSKEKGSRFDFPFDVVHDAQVVLYGDPRRALGVSNGNPDRETVREGALEIFAMNEESSGEQANRRITPLLNILRGKDDIPEGLGAVFNPDELNDHYKGIIGEYVETVFTPNTEKGQVTVLLDEPETSLGLMNQILLWEKILKDPEIKEKFQIILVSHSSNALKIEGANYIEMKEGYLEACHKMLNGELTIEEAQNYASNVQKKLTDKENEWLVRISEMGNEGFGETEETLASEEVKRLLELKFIDVWSKPKQYKKSLLDDFDDGRYNSIYTLSARGSQHLSMHK